MKNFLQEGAKLAATHTFHRCTLFDFLVEVRGSDRGTSVVFRASIGLSTGYRGTPRVSKARATAFHCAWRFHGKCHGCGDGTCRGSLRGNLRGTNHANPRTYHGNCHGLFHGPPHVVGIAVGLSAVPRPAVVCRGCLPRVVEIVVEIAVDLAVEIAVEIARIVPWASTRCSATCRGIPWKRMECPWKPVECPR